MDTVAALSGYDDSLSELAGDPTKLLLPQSEWPAIPRKPFKKLHSSYPHLVHKAFSVGLLEPSTSAGVLHQNGVPIEGGGFGVAKDEKEDRWISPLEFSNDVVDLTRMPVMLTPYMPQLAGVFISPKDRVLVSKRDARHYFHQLRTHPSWRPFPVSPKLMIWTLVMWYILDIARGQWGFGLQLQLHNG